MTRFETFEALGKAVKADNPSITKDDITIGEIYAKKNPDKVIVGESDPSFMRGPAATGVPPSLMSALQGGLDYANTVMAPIKTVADAPFRALDAIRGPTAGVASGMVMGVDKPIQAGMESVMGNAPGSSMDRSGMGYLGGEIVGEIVGPYKIIGGILPNVARGATSGVIQRGVRSGVESAVVEGGKAVFRGDLNPFDDAAIGFGLGMAGDVVIGGLVRGGRAGLSKLIKPKAGEVIDEKMITWLQDHNLPVLPATVRRMSNLIPFIEQKITQNIALKAKMESAMLTLSNGLKSAKQDFITSVGENAALHTPLESGKALYDRIDDVYMHGKNEVAKRYNGLRATGMGEVEINPNAPYIRHMEDGSEHETSLWASLREAIGDNIADVKPQKEGPKINKYLHGLFQNLKSAHAPKTSTVSEPIVGSSFLRPKAPKSIERTVEGEDIVQDYNWWWEQLQTMGEMLDTSAIKKSDKAKRKLLRAYHAIQDGIDGHASLKDPNYATAIGEARTLAQSNRAYGDIPLVKTIRSAEDKYRSEEMIDVIFRNQESVIEAKRILGPSDFDQARQAWLRSVMEDAVTKGDDLLKNPDDFGRLWENIGKKVGGDVDSPFVITVFSDEGFVVQNAMDTPLVADTGAAEKLEAFREFYDRFRAMDATIFRIRPRAQEFGGAGEQRGDPSKFVRPVASLKDGLAMLRPIRELGWSILTMKKLGKEYMKAPNENIFLLKDIPEWQGNVSLPAIVSRAKKGLFGTGVAGTPGAGQVSASARTGVQNALLNKLNILRPPPYDPSQPQP